MAVPKKKKIDFKMNPPKPGNEYLKYGMDRIEELMLDTNQKTNYLPRTIKFEDIDLAAYDFIDSGKLNLVIDGKDVPAIYLENDRWGEFSKTWKISDKDKNVPTPYVTVRRLGKEKGTRIGDKNAIAQLRKFTYSDVPILDDGEVVNLRFKTPEPTNVDLMYEFILFTKYRQDVNEYDEIIFKTFKSLQDFVFIKGNPMPVMFEGADEANTIENIDGDRMFIAKYKLKIKGFIQKEDEFEIVKTTRPPRFKYSV